MHLYRNSIFCDQHMVKEEQFSKLEKKEVQFRNHKYISEKFMTLNNKVLFWYYRDENVFEKNGEYFKVNSDGTEEIIDPSEFEEIKRKHSYFNIIDINDSVIYTINTTQTKTILNVGVLKQFFNLNNLKIINEIDIKYVLESINPNKMKLVWKNDGQQHLSKSQKVADFTEGYLYHVFGGSNFTLNMSINNKNLFRTNAEKELEKLDDSGAKFHIYGSDENGNQIELQNHHMKKSIDLNDVPLSEYNSKQIFEVILDGIKRNVI